MWKDTNIISQQGDILHGPIDIVIDENNHIIGEFVDGKMKFIKIINNNKIKDHIIFNKDQQLNGNIILNFEEFSFRDGKMQ